MANLFFPQLLSGAIAQFPIRKLKGFRTVANVYADGTMTVFPDAAASKIAWQLVYNGLSTTELTSLQTFFAQCEGSLRPFTFIDPTDNMLVSSVDLSAGVWVASPGCVSLPGTTDPSGGASAFTLINTGQSPAGLTQTLEVPANYQYCFSAYIRSSGFSKLTVRRGGSSASQSDVFTASSEWTRIVSSGRVNDPGTSFSVSVSITPGDQVQLFGPQLEPQHAPAGYRSTTIRGGVYPNCHWATSSLPVTAAGPGVFATELGIESSI